MIRIVAAVGILALAGCGDVKMKSQSAASCGDPGWIGAQYLPNGASIGYGGNTVREEALTKPYRVIPAGSSYTQDYNPARTSIFLDNTGKIADVKCG